MNIAQPLFTIGDKTTTPTTLLWAVAIVIATIVFGKIIYWMFRHRIKRLHAQGAESLMIYASIAKVLVWFIGLATILYLFGLKLSTILTTSGFLAVATGFASRNFIENIIAGLILRIERIIQPGDIIIVNNKWLTVERIGIRITETRTFVGEEIVIPNSKISEASIENLTRSDQTYRIDIKIRVECGSDLALVKKTLEETIDKLDWKSSEKTSTFYLDELGTTNVVYCITLWVDDVRTHVPRKSEALEAFWWALNEKGFTIASPSMNVNLQRNTLATGEKKIRPHVR